MFPVGSRESGPLNGDGERLVGDVGVDVVAAVHVSVEAGGFVGREIAFEGDVIARKVMNGVVVDFGGGGVVF